MPHRFASDTLDALVFLMPQGTLVCSQTAGLFEPEHPIMPDMHQLLHYNPWLLSIAPHSIGRPGQHQLSRLFPGYSHGQPAFSISREMQSNQSCNRFSVSRERMRFLVTKASKQKMHR